MSEKPRGINRYPKHHAKNTPAEKLAKLRASAAEMRKSIPKRAKRFDAKMEAAFFAELSKVPNVAGAAAKAGISLTVVYKRRKIDVAFAERWEEAFATATARLEKEAVRRAYEGVLEPIFWRGEVVYQVRNYSDRLLERLLEAHHPAHRHRHEIFGGGLEGAQPSDIEDRIGERLDELAKRLRVVDPGMSEALEIEAVAKRERDEEPGGSGGAAA